MRGQSAKAKVATKCARSCRYTKTDPSLPSRAWRRQTSRAWRRQTNPRAWARQTDPRPGPGRRTELAALGG
eukprot:5343415-Prymnesium_polylepis.1